MKHILFIITITFVIGGTEDYLWPVQAKKELTAIFGEERPRRYHTGIDVRTFGKIGFKLIAVEDGYISRVRTSSKGYGKTIYLKLNDGNTAVYAHLDHFSPEIDNLVSALHQHYNRYTIDHDLEPNKYKVMKGDVIGYSGDTGGISGPHLHFEIRNKLGQPINPFLNSLDLPDKIPPIVELLAVIPLDDNAIIDGFHEQKIYNLEKINNNKYILPDTIFVSGNVGLAIKTHDKITGQYFNFGIYSASLLLDAEFIYSMQYDEINWDNSNKIYLEKNYTLDKMGLGKFHHLFTKSNSRDFSFINRASRKGYLFDKEVTHDAIIDIYDFAKNKVEIHAYFVSDTLPSFNYSVEFNGSTCLVQFENKKLRPYFYLTGINSQDPVIGAKYYEMGNNLYRIDDIAYPMDVIKISAKNQKGVSILPSFHSEPKDNYKNIEGKFKIKHYEYGIIISFIEKYFTGMGAYLSLVKSNKKEIYNLKRDSKLSLSSELLNPLIFKDALEIKIYYESTEPFEIFSMKIEGALTYPDSTFNINLLNDRILINGNKNTFNDTTFFWIESAKTIVPDKVDMITESFSLFPKIIPYNNKIELRILIEPNYYTDNIGIYSYNSKTQKWTYLNSELSNDNNYITTSIISSETFAVLKEDQPPILYNFVPAIDGTYYASDIEHLSFNIKDDFSGIDGELDVIVKLNNKPIIFEYNSYQKKIRYPLKYNLKKGSHALYVQASDKVGNQTIINGSFYIK